MVIDGHEIDLVGLVIYNLTSLELHRRGMYTPEVSGSPETMYMYARQFGYTEEKVIKWMQAAIEETKWLWEVEDGLHDDEFQIFDCIDHDRKHKADEEREVKPKS